MITRDIRKVSVGLDLKDAMHFQVGSRVIDKTFEISHIREYPDRYDVYIEKVEGNSSEFSVGESVIWKTLQKTLPIMVENSIHF